MKPPHKELVADGNRQKPPKMVKPSHSTTSSDAFTVLDDIDDDLSSSASESYARDESSSEDESTCCDEDFTWVCNAKGKLPDAENIRNSFTSLPSQTGSLKASTKRDINNGDNTVKYEDDPKYMNRSVKPTSSLDRRRTLTRNRQERDSKSRSAHSLQDSSTTDYAPTDPTSKGVQHQKCSGKKNYGNHGKQNYKQHSHHNHHRPKLQPPIFWERPYFPNWDPNVHYSSNYHVPDDYDDYCQRQSHNDYCRYDSDGTLNILKPKMMSPGPVKSNGLSDFCPNRFYTKPSPVQACCSCESSSSMALPMWRSNQRQDTDERFRRLKSDKESLAMQVQLLSEQVSAQTDKIDELERLINEKTHLVSNTEDLLQREMLTRSSLETQKLELMSALSEIKLHQAALERENLELRSTHLNNNTISTDRRLPPVPASRFRTNSSSGSMTPPSTGRRQVDIQYNSLPRATSATTSTPIQSSANDSVNDSSSNGNSIDSNANLKQRNIVAFGKQLKNIPYSATKSATNIYHHQLVLYQQPDSASIVSPLLNYGSQKQRGVSVPNLAETEKIIDDIADIPTQTSYSPSMSQKSKSLSGLRSIFGKLRRSNSGNLEDLPLDGNEFRRGGIRATAGPRLGWNNAPATNGYRLSVERTKSFADWNVDAVCSWFDEMGLGFYEDELRKWLKHGAIDLMNATSADIEREINLKSPLHRKKITLALMEITGKDTDESFLCAAKLDIVWVMRWLDDIGLPQHKDAFSNARIDGRMLHRLSVDDLAALHVTSSLHAASLRRAIQVMRANKWSPDCLVRRSCQIDDEQPNDDLTKDIHLWTAHRVMEWLRVVNLAEYAPNLRGAGVHGALMVYEDRFTDELLADLLSIPSTKSLIRRHLCTHFKDLLGRDIIQSKRKAETTLGYQPLTLTAKIKTPKKSQFTLKRKKNAKAVDEWGDLVCPIGQSGEDLNSSSSSSSNTNNNQTNMMSRMQQTDDEAASREINSLSLKDQPENSPISIRSSNS